MIIAENAQARCIAEIISIYLATVAVPERELGGTITDGIVADSYSRSFDRDHFILAITFFKYVMFENTVA